MPSTSPECSSDCSAVSSDTVTPRPIAAPVGSQRSRRTWSRTVVRSSSSPTADEAARPAHRPGDCPGPGGRDPLPRREGGGGFARHHLPLDAPAGAGRETEGEIMSTQASQDQYSTFGVTLMCALSGVIGFLLAVAVVLASS